MTSEWEVGRVEDLKPGTRRIINVKGRQVGVFNVAGRFYALRNICPHQGAPLCEGEIGSTLLPSRPGEYVVGREGEVLRCPWHQWEFDITSGRCLVDSRVRVKTFEVVVRDGHLFLIA
ncbi:MAG: Rieske (2Fe-2S) protein [Rhodothermia bacterium]|nr:Rieske (2Fe-2S) protein [Rhodothermia bacterium]